MFILFFMNMGSLFFIFFFTYVFLYPLFLDENICSILFWSLCNYVTFYITSYGFDGNSDFYSPSVDNLFLGDLVLEIQFSDLFKGYEPWSPSLFLFLKETVGLFGFISLLFVLFYLLFIFILANSSLFTHLENSVFGYYFFSIFLYFFMNAFVLQLSDFILSPFIFGFSILKGNLLYNIDVLGDGLDIHFGEKLPKQFSFVQMFWFFFYTSLFTFPFFTKLMYLSDIKFVVVSIFSKWRVLLLSIGSLFLLFWVEFDIPFYRNALFLFIMTTFLLLYTFYLFKMVYTYYWYRIVHISLNRLHLSKKFNL
jgi:hypothetical protein